MTPDTAFLTGLDAFDRVVQQVPDGAWDRPAPCEGWTALDVLGHVVRVLDVGAVILRGETPDWTPPEGRPALLVGDGDPKARWTGAATAAREAMAGDVDLERVVDSPMGKRTVGQGLSFPAVDLHVHAWDLARATGVAYEVAPEAAAFAHEVIDPMGEQSRQAGVFGPQVALDGDASDSDRFLAWTGRDPR